MQLQRQASRRVSDLEYVEIRLSMPGFQCVVVSKPVNNTVLAVV